jgi:F-type H+-transporting ATPase subunit b
VDLFKSVFGTFNVRFEYLVWYLVLFAIVLWAANRFLFRRFMTTIDSRQAEINESLDRAEEAAKSVDASKEKAEKILWDASNEAQELVRRAEKIGNDLQEKAREDARIEAQEIVAKAQADIERERAAAVADIRRQAVALAVAGAGRVIELNLDSDVNRRLAEETIQKADLRS